MNSSRRANTMTRFLEDIVDDTKGLLDDLLDRAKNAERNSRDAVMDVHSEPGDDTDPDMAALQGELVTLSARIDELARIQKRASEAELESMTKVELQELAQKRGFDDVNQNTQTKDEMISAIRRGA